MKKTNVAVVECFPKRGEPIKGLIEEFGKDFYAEIFRAHKGELPDGSFDAYIYSGGIGTVFEKDKYPYLEKLEELARRISKLGKPLLGICLGHQIIAEAFGGKVDEAENLEVGFQRIRAVKKDFLLKDIPEKFHAFTYHWHYVSRLPPNFETLAESKMCRIHAMRHKEKPIFGIQFHIEYDSGAAKEILDYLKDEISGESLDYKKLLEDTKLYSGEISGKIIRNFLETARNPGLKNQ